MREGGAFEATEMKKEGIDLQYMPIASLPFSPQFLGHQLETRT